MGVYSSAFTESTLNNQTVDLLDESIDISKTPSIEENGFGKLIAETEANYTMFMKAVGICELAATERDGDVIYEAADVSGFFGKVKQFFKNILEKIKRLFKKFLVNFDSWTKSNKDFVDKYKKQITMAKLTDFEYSGYKFTDTGKTMTSTAYTTFASAACGHAKATAVGKYDASKLLSADPDSIVTGVEGISNKDDYDDVMTAKQKFDENYEDVQDALRLQALNHLTKKPTSPVASDEFAEEIFKAFHNGETSKETLTSSDINITSLMATLINYDKVKKDTEKSYHEFDKGINNYLKALESAENKLLKKVPGKGADGTVDEDKTKATSVALAYVGVANRIMKDAQQYAQQVENGRLQALKDEAKQAKAICTKLITRKVKEDADMSGDDEFGVSHARTALDNVNFV